MRIRIQAAIECGYRSESKPETLLYSRVGAGAASKFHPERNPHKNDPFAFWVFPPTPSNLRQENTNLFITFSGTLQVPTRQKIYEKFVLGTRQTEFASRAMN
jgi:hypothetical protein